MDIGKCSIVTLSEFTALAQIREIILGYFRDHKPVFIV